jgi:hypothetical protein
LIEAVKDAFYESFPTRTARQVENIFNEHIGFGILHHGHPGQYIPRQIVTDFQW